MIGKALLPAPSGSKSLPAPAASTPVAETPPAPAEKTDVVAEAKAEVKEETPAPAATSTPEQVNATPPRPTYLSPYPYVSEFCTVFYAIHLQIFYELLKG